MMTFRILGYQEDSNTWAAHCLETDLKGYGKSFKKAVDDLIELTAMQITFALSKKEMSLLDCPAPARIHEAYSLVFSKQIQSLPKKRSVDPERRVTSIPVTLPAHCEGFSLATA